MKKELFHFYRFYSGRRRLTIQEKESIFDAVIAKTIKPKKRLIWTIIRSPAGVCTALVAGCLLLAIPAVILLTDRENIEDEFVARGEDPKPLFVVRCMGAEDAEDTALCTRGGTLVFKVYPPQGRKFFAAFSRRENSNSVIWYYPAEEGDTCVSIPDEGIGRALNDGIVIGDEHALGIYEIYGVFSERPCRRDDIRRLFENSYVEKDNVYTILKTKVQIQ